MYTESTTNKELAILSYIDRNSNATQRELSEHVGMSLGAINLLLKRLLTKGLIKMDRLQPNSVKYFLTPEGLANKLERTYHYIIRTYQEIDTLRNRIVTTVNILSETHKEIIFYGPQDDFSLMVQDLIITDSFTAKVTLQHTIPTLHTSPTPILIWHNDSAKALQKRGLKSVNILGMISIPMQGQLGD